MFKDALKLRIEELTKEREKLFDQIEPLQERNHTIFNEIQSLQNKLSAIERDEIETPETTLDEKIAFYLENDGDSKGMDHYKAKEKFWNNFGFSTSGYFPSIQQQCLQFSLDHDKSKDEETAKRILQVLPHMKPVIGIDDNREDTALKAFRIMEYTLSEFGSYSVFFNEETSEWILSVIRWHRRSDVYVTNSLEDLLDYISTHHPYDNPCEDEEDY